VIDKLLQGDADGALKSLDAKDSPEMSVEPHTTLGVSCAPGISVMGFGVGMEFEAIRKDVKGTTEFKGQPVAGGAGVGEGAAAVRGGGAHDAGAGPRRVGRDRTEDRGETGAGVAPVFT
jgi:hypothetical protein